MSYDTDPVMDKLGVFEEKFTIVMADPAKWIGKYWVWDDSTETLRAYTHSSYALTWDKSDAVIMPFDASNADQKQVYDKGTYHLRNSKNAKQCFKGDPKEGEQVKMEGCTEDDITEMWYPQYHYQAQGPHWNRLQNE